jgi:hypothetical protein
MATMYSTARPLMRLTISSALHVKQRLPSARVLREPRPDVQQDGPMPGCVRAAVADRLALPSKAPSSLSNGRWITHPASASWEMGIAFSSQRSTRMLSPTVSLCALWLGTLLYSAPPRFAVYPSWSRIAAALCGILSWFRSGCPWLPMNPTLQALDVHSCLGFLLLLYSSPRVSPVPCSLQIWAPRRCSTTDKLCCLDLRAPHCVLSQYGLPLWSPAASALRVRLPSSGTAPSVPISRCAGDPRLGVLRSVFS